MRTKIEKKLKGKKEISLNKLSYAKKITPRLLLLFIQSLRMLVYLSYFSGESHRKKMRHLQLKGKSLKFIIMKLYLILFLVQNLLDIIM